MRESTGLPFERPTFILPCFVLLAALGGAAGAQPQPPEGVWVRPGYELAVAAQFDFRPRFMAVDSDGALYVSDPRGGTITRCTDADGDGLFEQKTTFISDRPRVHGMQWHDRYLWFTQSGSIHRARDTNGDGRADDIITVIAQGRLPAGGGHWWRSIRIHEGRLYTSIGDSGNINDETDTERQKIWSFDLDGRDKQLFASGLRNTEKLVIRPGTSELWGMDHGSDWFGRPIGDKRGKQPVTDLNPPDEMNHYVQGGFYGHPFVVGNKLPRYEYLERDDIIDLADKTIPPAWPTGSHWAPNAMCFYDAQQFPETVRGDAFVAYHGSWNRENRAGYQVTRVLFEDGRPYGELPYVKFITDSGQVLGRPVDVVVDDDGSLLISDDFGRKKMIYRLRYVGR